VVEQLPRKLKALNSIQTPVLPKKKERKNEKEKNKV
jgi:hypothetical protein